MTKAKLTAEGEYLLDDGSNYDKNAYEKPSVTVDICICKIEDNDLKVLLIKRKNPPYRNYWAIPGGFVDIERKEDLKTAALRELEEETGVTGVDVHQLATYGDPNRDPRMRIITVAYYAIVPSELINSQKIEAADDAKEYQWASLRDLPRMAFDHKKILSDFDERLRGRIEYTTDGFKFLMSEFTWSELQNVYEIVLDRPLIAPNFRRKIKSMYKINKSNNRKELDKGRPAQLFTFGGSINKF